ncbi:hypothetical protein BKA70DRAFT_1569974 [Coprinopsis sp. MPI-PUGE-AT-0042]|nr:hypothetical protein BKA70DRAFT_1569974 [Coprinopsis sp. MPI-PUGE-AT-0042]
MFSPPSDRRHLPRELIDAVIDELSGENASLLSCSLVHPTWRVRAQYHLLKEITLALIASPTTQPQRKQPEPLRFADSVTSRSELACLVHSVTIQGYEDDSDWESDIQPEDVASFEARCSALVRIIPLLKCVRKVSLEDLLNAADWGNLPFPLQSAIFELISQSSITEAHFFSVEGMPFIPILRFHHLEHLEMRVVVPDPAELDAPFPLNTRYDAHHAFDIPRAFCLALDNDQDPLFLKYLLMSDVAWFSTLTSLTLGSSAWSETCAKTDLLRFFRLVRDTLNTYEVKQVAFLGGDEPQIFSASLLRLDLIPNLQNLSFELNWHYLECIPEQRDIMADITEALKLIAVPGNVLKTFQLTIAFEHPDSADDDEQIYPPRAWFDQWVALDDVLSSAHFSFLVPSTAGENTISSALVTLNFDELKCQKLPVPFGHTAPLIEILEQMKTLQITSLPVKWYQFQKCWKLQSGQRRQLLSEHLPCLCNDCV